MGICLTCCCNINSQIRYYISWFSGTLNNAFKSDGGAPFLLPLLWQMVYGRVGYCPLSCLLYTLMSLCSESWRGLSQERTVCWLPMLCRWSCSTCPISLCTQKNVEDMLWVCCWKEFGVQCWEDSIDMFLPTQIYCGWWLHWILWAETDSVSHLGHICHVTYLIHLILKTKPKSLFGVPTASGLILEYALLL